MKKSCIKAICAVLVVILAFSLAGCGANTKDSGSLWDNAMYFEDATLGNGAKTFTVTVSAEEKEVIFTVNTDKATVGEALQELALIEGEPGDFGLYIKKVNGITADYDVNQSYWAFYIGGEFALSGVDTTEITEGAVYKLEYTKG